MKEHQATLVADGFIFLEAPRWFDNRLRYSTFSIPSFMSSLKTVRAASFVRYRDARRESAFCRTRRPLSCHARKGN